MSVTEIKRLAHRGEENPGSDLYQPPVTEAEITIPVLHSRMKEEPVKGNEMGTVIHKIMELIDFTRNSMDEIREQIRSFLIMDIWKNGTESMFVQIRFITWSTAHSESVWQKHRRTIPYTGSSSFISA